MAFGKAAYNPDLLPEAIAGVRQALKCEHQFIEALKNEAENSKNYYMSAKKIIAFILLGISYTGAEAQNKFMSSSNETREVSQKVTQLFKENKAHEAIAIIRPYWPLPAIEMDALEEKTIQSLNLISQRFGKSEGIIKVSEELIKDFAIKETYFVKFENSAIRLVFIYYKNEKGWIINSFKWDDNFILEFK